MSLVNISQGDFTPHIRYMASTSSWTMSSENGQVPFQFTQAIFDFENVKTGLGHISEGNAPQWIWDANGALAAIPAGDTRDYKRGFGVNVYSKQLFGDEAVREFATTGTGAVMGINAVYEQYEAQKDANAGKVPVVEFSGGVPTKVGKGNTSVPTLNIVKWVDRPADLVAEAAPVVNIQPQATAPAVPAQTVAAAGGSEF